MPILKHKPLQDLCLNTIINHFDDFSFAYLSSTPLIPSRHFEFLQRMYSDTIAEKLADRDNMKEEYLQLVINKYAKVFHMEQFRHCDWDVVERRIFEVAETILKITMVDDIPNDLLTNVVSRFKNVDTLILSNTHCSNETIKVVGECCPLVRMLDISYCVLVTNKGVKYLCNDVNGVPINSILQNLNVNATSVEDAGISFCLQHMPSLEVLSYENIPRVLFAIYKNNLDENPLATSKKYNLTGLDFLYPNAAQLSELLKVCSVLCPRVKSLHVASIQKEEQINLCCKFNKLESVKLTGKPLTIEDIEKTISLNNFLEVSGRKLNSLDLSSFSVSAKVIARCCPLLKTLSLKDVIFERSLDLNLSPLTYLTSFALDEAVFTHKNTARSTLSILSASPNLEVLRLHRGREFSPEITAAVIKCSSRLKELDFSFSDIELPFLETILLTSSTLEKLNLEYCEHISSMEYDTLLDMLCMTKNHVDIIWTDSASDYTYSDYDEDIFDEYDVLFDESDYAYEQCDEYVDDMYECINDSLDEI